MLVLSVTLEGRNPIPYYILRILTITILYVILLYLPIMPSTTLRTATRDL
jgi:uncharacterized membrane protein YwaF